MGEDRLTKIFKEQVDFSKKWFLEKKGLDLFNLSQEERKKWSKEYILAAINELCEALNELKWKTHREFEKTDNIDNFNEECIDVFKFLLNLLLINGVNEEMFYQKFIDKSKVVQLRYEQETALTKLKGDENAKIAVVDIDGCLNNYPLHFLEFASNSANIHFDTVPDFKETKIKLYNNLKHDYRSQGWERHNVVSAEARLFLESLKREGYTVVLLSARPWEKYKNLYNDTLSWLTAECLMFDLLVFNKNKDQYIIDNLSGHNVAFCVDDDFNNARNLSYHFKTYLMKNAALHNEEAYKHVPKKAILINSLFQIEEAKI